MAATTTKNNGTNFDRANESVKNMGNAYHALLDIDLRKLRGDATTREEIKAARKYLEDAMALIQEASGKL